ncbi:MAG: ferritin family protein [bacterium]
MMFKSLDEVIAFAIGREAQAANFYQVFAARSEKPATKSMFAELAAEEKKHQELLEKLTPEQLKNFQPTKLEDLGLDSILKDTQFSPDMEYPGALRMALKRETESIRLYSFFAEQLMKDKTECQTSVERKQLKQLFDFLVAQEQQHKNKLENEYDAVVLKDY